MVSNNYINLFDGIELWQKVEAELAFLERRHSCELQLLEGSSILCTLKCMLGYHFLMPLITEKIYRLNMLHLCGVKACAQLSTGIIGLTSQPSDY